MLRALAIWLQNTSLFVFLREGWYGQWYWVILSLHVTFISLFAATILMTDLRLLGLFMTRIPIPNFIDQFRVPKRVGFLCAGTCGLLLFGIKAEEYYLNAFFRVKMLLFGLILAHALVFRSSVYSKSVKLDRMGQTYPQTRIAAALSLVLWVGVVLAGRGIGYIQPPPFSHHFARLVAPVRSIVIANSIRPRTVRDNATPGFENCTGWLRDRPDRRRKVCPSQ